MAYKIGPDGIAEIYPTNPNAKAKPFYINLDNPDENNKVFATVYGSDITKFDKPALEGKAKYVRNKLHKVTYASGAAPGLSGRFHISASGQMGAVGKHSWKDNPSPEYVTASDVCFYSHEMTAVVRVGKALGTHQSTAFKLNSRPDKPDDTLRSTIEICMNNDQKKVPYVNYNYAHAGYESVGGVEQKSTEGKITPGQIIGLKCVFIIADDKKSTLIQLYVNTDPVDTATGQFKNDGWKLKAQYTAKGISQYQNKPPVWGGDSYLRIDGYEYVDLFAYSQREILKEGGGGIVTPDPKPKPPVPPVVNPPKPPNPPDVKPPKPPIDPVIIPPKPPLPPNPPVVTPPTTPPTPPTPVPHPTGCCCSCCKEEQK